ncbi:MAG: hypothetical protein AB7V77_03130 [Candidatus Woesearchaeota archaeon]
MLRKNKKGDATFIVVGLIIAVLILTFGTDIFTNIFDSFNDFVQTTTYKPGCSNIDNYGYTIQEKYFEPCSAHFTSVLNKDIWGNNEPLNFVSARNIEYYEQLFLVEEKNVVAGLKPTYDQLKCLKDNSKDFIQGDKTDFNLFKLTVFERESDNAINNIKLGNAINNIKLGLPPAVKEEVGDFVIVCYLLDD